MRSIKNSELTGVIQNAPPTIFSVLYPLTKNRIRQVARHFGVLLVSEIPKDKQLALLCEQTLQLDDIIAQLGRDELRASCKYHGLDEKGRSRSELAQRIIAAAQLPAPCRKQTSDDLNTFRLPREGDIVVARHRQYLVEEAKPACSKEDMSRIRLVCLDDDAQGRELELLWELELGAQVVQPDERLGKFSQMDSPRHFAAYLHALKWSCVSATDANLFQSPFRAGIKLLHHQLVPLLKALALPRVNLFIADDVGIGKTIEAGLVAEELILRQWVDWTLIVCPAAVCHQWRDEMEKRFGLRFEIHDRSFVGRKRQERGFGVNPWGTHNRFIISYQTLRRPEYRDPLLHLLGNRARRSLLILDEAHTAAPSTASQYAVDSTVTRVVRDIAPRFENRLFLSATPHNGHSNSFSSLLEILDPQRFTRGVTVRNKQLEPVMVRRLKADLRAIDENSFPERQVVQVSIRNSNNQWHEQWTFGGETPEPERNLGTGEPVELRLSELLNQYTKLMQPKKGRGRLVFVNLQKRLLSSVDAFFRTLTVHAKSLETLAKRSKSPQEDEVELLADGLSDDGDDFEDFDDEACEALAEDEVAHSSQKLEVPGIQAQALLMQMLELARKYRDTPDGKVLAFLAWIRRFQCPAAGLGHSARVSKKWSERRVIIFTEYAHTKSYLRRILEGAFQDAEDGESRILELGGGLSDERREEIQRAFNAPPDEHPVRILLATDAAREGINLQGQCADLFHFDVPWNPARMEQRNGRIDRTLQKSQQVRCAYFFYPQRREDVVLRTLVEKVDRIQRELGSLGNVVMERLDSAFATGIDETTTGRLEATGVLQAELRTATDELKQQQQTSKRLAEESDAVGRVLESSRKVMEFRSELLRDAIEVGCELAGAGPLKEITGRDGSREVVAYEIPPLPESWTRTLDSLRPPKNRDESFWDWRQRPLLPVVFEPPNGLSSPLVHLHLQHPFVQRILSRFLAQGFSAHDLSRVTVVKSRRDAMARVIVFGRLSLFGKGAIRLHDELVSVGALWLEHGGQGHLRPFGEKADRKSIEQLEDIFREAQSSDAVSKVVQKRLLTSAASDFESLWKHVQNEADQRSHHARQKLEARGYAEAEALKEILLEQKSAIQRTLTERAQLQFIFSEKEAEQQAQYLADEKHMKSRLNEIEREIIAEPAELIARYQVALTRLQAIGMIYLWPEGR